MAKINKYLGEELGSEEKYKKLFNLIDEGFFLIEVIFNENNKPVDMIYLESNAAATKMMGMNFTGKHLREIDPNYEEYWYEIFGKVALTGESVRMEQYAEPDKKWYNFFIFKVGGPESHVIGNIFEDITERKKAEEALKESQKIYRTLFENTDDAFQLVEIIYDKNGNVCDFRYLKTNSAFERQSGLQSSEIIDKRVTQVLPNVEPYWFEMYDKVVKEGKPVHDENYNQDTKRWYNMFFFPYAKDQVGVLFRDITDIKKAEELIRNTKDQYNLLFNSVSEGFALYKAIRDKNDRLCDILVLEINPEGAAQSGVKREDQIGKTWLQVWGSDIPDSLFDVYRQVDESGETLHFEHFSHITNRWYSNSLYKIDKDRLSVTFFDITERKKAEEELRESRDNLEVRVEERTAELEKINESLIRSQAALEAFFESSPGILNLEDENFCYINTDPITPTYFGLTRETIKGKCVKDVAPEFIENFGPMMQHVIDTGKPKFNVEVNSPVPAKPGQIAHWRASYFPVPLIGGETGIGIMGVEITDLKKAEEQLQETIKELKRSNEELQQFAYVSSHDLQEPLRTIASFSQLLERRYKGQLDSDADEFIDFIVDAAKRMKQQIEDLLEFSRVETKGREFGPVDMNLIVNEVFQSLNPSVDECNAEILIDELPTVTGDAGQLQRVFQNLISNALKFRKPDESPKIHISAYKSEDGNEYVFSVTDNGIGIEEQYMGRIFVIFQKLNTMSKYKGTGIGLSIVKRIIERHGGRIWVESELDVGSTFYFTIPF